MASNYNGRSRWWMLLCCSTPVEPPEDVFTEPQVAASTTPQEEHLIVGNYRLLQTLGKGSYAEVRLAQHIKTGKQVAVKIIDKNNFDPLCVEQISQESKFLRLLNHPNIVQLYEEIETSDALYFVMEYVSGGNLFNYLKDHGRMEENKAHALFRQMVSAVNHCHQNGILHGDLAPDNILVDADGNIKISDFGISSWITPDYGPEVDLYSLGVVLYEMLTCYRPDYGAEPVQMVQLDSEGYHDVPYYISNDCKNLLLKLMLRDPSAIYSISCDFSETLEGTCTGLYILNVL
ncbi:serine/threonine-protein kinase MARK2-like [Bombina bombina]|uniref:serine/threonine-protein kinase MARK2-like n=1 Tax=Bombina bombina TaxID=8345 RepID=UPI00235A7D0E|nr:serine/threonine-protein kinase MARK2-like [Bombina bombina]